VSPEQAPPSPELGESERRPDSPAAAEPISPDDILVIRRGPGANCSSIGSVLDVLFLSAVAGGVILVGVAALLEERAAAPAPEANPARESGEDEDAPGAR
jgi:hypothetical protein